MTTKAYKPFIYPIIKLYGFYVSLFEILVHIVPIIYPLKNLHIGLYVVRPQISLPLSPNTEPWQAWSITYQQHSGQRPPYY